MTQPRIMFHHYIHYWSILLLNKKHSNQLCSLSFAAGDRDSTLSEIHKSYKFMDLTFKKILLAN